MVTTNYHGKLRSKDDLRRLPEHVQEQIVFLAENPDYQHVSGCGDSCKNCPGENVSMYRKIAIAVGTDATTVHAYLDNGVRKRCNDSWARSKISPQTITTRKAYEKSQEGIARIVRYRATEKGIEVWKKIREGRKESQLKTKLA